MTDPVTPATTTPVTGPKSGYRTTEFWLSAVATLLGVILASGAVLEGGVVAQIVGGLLSVLSSLGYTAARAKVKAGG